MPPGARRGRGVAARGFTLVELLVVLAIIGLVLGLALPQLRELSGVELRSAARRLAGAARYASEQAAVRKSPHRIRFDFEQRAYRVEVAEGDRWLPDPATLGAAVRLPGAVRIAAVETRARGRQTDGEAWVEFYPKGYSELAVVQLVAGNERVYSVEIRPFDLRPRIEAGALTLREIDSHALPRAASTDRR